MNRVFDDNPPSVLGERKLMVILCTDGKLTDSNGNVEISRFKSLLTQRHSIVYTNIVCCTDDDESIGYLNRLDNESPRLDVIGINF